MSEPGLKLTTYFEERDRAGERFLSDALFDVYERHRMRTSILLRGALGYGQRHELHSDRLLTLSETLPAVSIAVDTSERIRAAAQDVLRVTSHGLISLERAELLSGEALAEVQLGTRADALTKLTVCGGRSVRAGGQPGYVAAVQLLRDCGASAASVLLGVDGTLHGERRRARFFARNQTVPLMLVAIGAARNLNAALPSLTELISEPVVTVERVRVCKSEGVQLSAPWEVPERDDSGLPIWHKVTIHTEEQASYGRHRLYTELVHRLSEAGAAGTTVLRGVRGFYGQRPVLADRVASLRRNVPVHIVVIDTAEGLRRWWPVVEEHTAHSGLVTSELVPASHAVASTRRATLRLASIRA